LWSKFVIGRSEAVEFSIAAVDDCPTKPSGKMRRAIFPESDPDFECTMYIANIYLGQRVPDATESIVWVSTRVQDGNHLACRGVKAVVICLTSEYAPGTTHEAPSRRCGRRYRLHPDVCLPGEPE